MTDNTLTVEDQVYIESLAAAMAYLSEGEMRKLVAAVVLKKD